MNPRRILTYAAALAATAAAAAVCVVAAAFAVYAAARPWLGPAGAAAIVAVLFALAAAGLAALALRKADLAGAPAAEDVSMVERLIQLARERPLMTLGAAAALMTVLVRNPGVLTAVLGAVLAGGASRPEK